MQVIAGADFSRRRRGPFLSSVEILVLGGPRMRLVTHLDVDAAGIERALAAARSFTKKPR